MPLLPTIFGRGRKPAATSFGHPAGEFLFFNGVVTSFAVNGMGQRHTVLTELLRTLYGEVPVIVLHG